MVGKLRDVAPELRDMIDRVLESCSPDSWVQIEASRQEVQGEPINGVESWSVVDPLVITIRLNNTRRGS